MIRISTGFSSSVHRRRVAHGVGLVSLPLRLVQRDGDFALIEILAAVPVVFGSGVGNVNGDVFPRLPGRRVGIRRKAGRIVGPDPERICYKI